MRPLDVVNYLLMAKNKQPVCKQACAFAPSNIALIKYWGKRDELLRLPITSSLSISLGDKGATTTISLSKDAVDSIYLNDQLLSLSDPFASRLCRFLDLFRFNDNYHYVVKTKSTIAIAAGLASSACGFAAIVKALHCFFDWQLANWQLSILARLGSGSACRSLWHGFVIWHRGKRDDGMDSYANYIAPLWPELRIGLLLLDTRAKKVSSSEAMRYSLNSPFYKTFAKQVAMDLKIMQQAISEHNFLTLGQTAERNALAMHACMLTANPPVLYWQPATVEIITTLWHYRKQGLEVFFTQDAGPNLKLLFLQKDLATIQKLFPQIEMIKPAVI